MAEQNPVISRNWCFTLNNYTDEHIQNVEELQNTSLYYIYGKEVGEEEETPHLQGFVHFGANKRLSAVRKLIPGAHLLVAKGSAAQNAKYCSKEGNFTEWGVRPMTAAEKGEKQKKKWKDIADAAIGGDLTVVQNDHPQAFICHYSSLKKIVKDNMKRPRDLDTVCGQWHYGEAGSGKTTAVRTKFPDAYIKSRDKWWDGYDGQDVVILDDMDPFCKALSGYLKDWADKWTCKAEEKGGYKWIRPLVFVVTSQYSIEDIFDDEQTRDALNRRYKKHHYTKTF